MVVATRSVSEAGALADRIALISHGRVKCCGGPTFLRRLFGLGYRLHVTFKRKLFATTAITAATASSVNGVAAMMDSSANGVAATSAPTNGVVLDEGLDVLTAARKFVPGAETLRGQPSDGGNGITLSLAAAAPLANQGNTPLIHS